MHIDRPKAPTAASCTHDRKRRGRHGIASLELVLMLPVLLFITALIINYGTIASWKISGLVVSRDALWKTRWPRANLAPAPEAWSPPATISTEAAEKFTVLDDPSINLPVARGPLTGATVRSNLLDPTRGPAAGRARTTRQQPLPPRLTTIRYDVRHVMLTDPWTYDTMGLGGNVVRRTKVLYELAKAPASLSKAFVSAVSAVYYGSFQAKLAPLEREPDYPRFGYASPDFQPRLQGFCGLDSDQVRKVNVENLIDRIRGNKQKSVSSVPKRMTRSFLSLYRRAIQDLENLLKLVPPLPPAQQAKIQQELAARKAELEPKIEELEDFQSKLSGS